MNRAMRRKAMAERRQAVRKATATARRVLAEQVMKEFAKKTLLSRAIPLLPPENEL